MWEQDSLHTFKVLLHQTLKCELKFWDFFNPHDWDFCIWEHGLSISWKCGFELAFSTCKHSLFNNVCLCVIILCNKLLCWYTTVTMKEEMRRVGWVEVGRGMRSANKHVYAAWALIIVEASMWGAFNILIKLFLF